MTKPRARISVDSHVVGGRRRTGEVLEVLGMPDHARYRVRWENGQETIVYPGSDAFLSLAGTREGGAHVEAVARPRRKASPAPRPSTAAGLRATPGDRLVVRSHRLGEPQRDAEVLDVLGPGGRPPFRVRWQDTGSETLFFPGSDALVEHFGPDRPAPRARAARRRRQA